MRSTAGSGIRWAAVALTLVVPLAACSDSSSPETTAAPTSTAAQTTTTSPPPTTAAPPTTTQPSTTTTAEPTTTTTEPDPDAPPELNLESDGTVGDFGRIVEEHLAYQRWMGLHPSIDASVIGVSIDPAGPYFETWQESMQLLLDRGLLRDQGELVVATIAFLPDSDPASGFAQLVLRVNNTTGSLVTERETGDVIQQSEPFGPFDLDVDLQRAGDGRWLLWDARTP